VEKIFAGSQLAMMVGLKAPGKSVFEAQAMEDIRKLTDAIHDIEGVALVTSLADAEFLRADGDSLIVESIVPDEYTGTPAQIREVKRRILSWDLYTKTLVSSDFRSTQIMVGINQDTKTADAVDAKEVAYKGVVQAGRALGLAERGWKVYLSGSPVPTTVMSDAMRRDLSMSQVGLRLETGLSGVDIGLQYWYGFNRLPTVDRAALPAALATGAGTVLEYDRLNHFGADFAAVLWDIGVRGEVAVNVTKDLKGDDPEVRNGTFEWAAGADRDVLGISANLQAKQVFLLGADERAASGDADEGLADIATTLSLSLKESFIRDTLELELIVVWGVEESEGLLLPSASLDVNDDLHFRVLGRYFFGPSDGTFGEYEDSSDVEFSVRYVF
jgi:hypothetical protein